MRDVTFNELARAGAAHAADAAESGDAIAFVMDEDAFRLFYDKTARPVWAYLSRITGDARLADDLLQEAYYRFLRSRTSYDDDNHRRNYLFRIATNLAHDVRRRPRADSVQLDEAAIDPRSTGDEASRVAGRVDLARAMARLKPRERDLLWLAYAQGSTHHEIAATLGLKTSSIKPLLFRARQRLAALLGRAPRGY